MLNYFFERYDKSHDAVVNHEWWTTPTTFAAETLKKTEPKKTSTRNQSAEVTFKQTEGC